MDCASLFTDIKAYGFDDLANSVLFTHLNYAAQDIYNIEAWPFLEKKLTGNFTATAQQFAAVTDIKQVLSLINVAQGYPLSWMRTESFYKDYVNVLTLTGNPVIYHTPTVNATAPNGLTVEVWPIPPVQAFQLRYLYIPPQFTLTTDIPVLPERYHRILTYGTLLSLYQMEDDTEASIRLQGLYDRQLMRMREDLWSSQYDTDDTIADVSGLDNWDSYY